MTQSTASVMNLASLIREELGTIEIWKFFVPFNAVRLSIG